MAVTQQDVANLSGVSRATVSNAFFRPEKVLPELREKVIAAASKLGYRPNSAARSIRSGRFDCISLLHDGRPSRSDLPKELLLGVNEALMAQDKHLSFSVIPDATIGNESEQPKILRHLMADGILMNYHGSLPPRAEAFLASAGLPVVWINTKRAADCVYPDDRKAGADLTRRLIELGHKRIVYTDVDFKGGDELLPHFSRIERPAGYRDAMAEADLPAECISIPGSARRTRQIYYDYIKGILTRPDRPTAIIGYGAEVVTFLHVAEALCGMLVPDDLSVASFGSKYDDHGLKISKMAIPWQSMGRAAGEMILQKIQNPQANLDPALIPLEFDPRNTGDSVGEAPDA